MIPELVERYGKVAKFAIASGIGFLIAEGILTVGILSLYGGIKAPKDAYSSAYFDAIDVAALGIGVAASFLLNERYTVDLATVDPGHKSRITTRLLKFEGVNALGTLTIIVVQYLLVLSLSISPVFGNIVGAVVSYPITYLVSMYFVWRRSPARPDLP